MGTEPMHGPVGHAIFLIWLGFVAAGGIAYLAYRLLRPWLNKARKPPPPPPMKYAEQLRQRMRKKPSRRAVESAQREPCNGKPPTIK